MAVNSEPPWNVVPVPSSSWLPLWHALPCWGRAGSLKQGCGSKRNQWYSRENLCSQTLTGFWVFLCRLEEPGARISKGFVEMCACKAGVTHSCLLPGTAVSLTWVALLPWGAALLSDPYFATWLLRIGVIVESFLKQICSSVHREFWLGVGNNAGLNNKLKILNTLRPWFDSFPKVIPQIPWLRYRKLLEQVLCLKPWSW